MTARDFFKRYLRVSLILMALCSLSIGYSSVALGLISEQPLSQIGFNGLAGPAASQQDIDAILGDPATSGSTLANRAAEDPEAAGLAIAAAASQDSQTTGATLASAVTINATSVSEALKFSAAADIAATLDALNLGLANDGESMAALGEVLPVELWLRPTNPGTGPDSGISGSWISSDVGKGQLESILAKFASPPVKMRVEVTKLPLAILSVKPTPTPMTKSAFSARPFEMPPFRPDQTPSSLFRLVVGSGKDSGFVGAYLTISVKKSWMEENDIHPWSISLQRHNKEDGVWESSPAQYFGEDESNMLFRTFVTEFSMTNWGITGQSSAGSDFAVSNLKIGESPGAGEPTEITVQVTNLTSNKLAPRVGLYVDSVAGSSKYVLLEPNETKPLTFSIKFNQGDYDIRVDRFTGSLSVGVAPPATPTPQPIESEPVADSDSGSDDGGINTTLVVLIIVVVVVLAIAGFVFKSRRK